MATILLAGCGAIGTALGQQLQAAGHQVYGLRRSAVALPFPCLQGDLHQPLPADLLPAGIHYVVHTGTPAERSDAGYEAGYPRALRHLLDALQEHPLRRLVFVSSTAVYHQTDGSWVDEDSPTRPQRFNGRRVLEAETLLRDAGVPGTSVRFGGIYGPGRTWLMRRVRAGAEVQASPPKYTNRIHQDDCVGLLAFLIQRVEQGFQPPPILVGVDDAPAPEQEVCQWLAQQLNTPPPRRVQAADSAPRNKRCRNQRLHQLGYRLRYPSYREGYSALLAESGAAW
ncbi:MAG: SDR family oxidoreductase [Pseudomonadota bacterium]|nr:NAD(P)-dependent oxidoreductase [Pseudomonadales bacterium]MDY6921466.1 SDR family oxidoreductase [Pseudomonadota bacterium]